MMDNQLTAKQQRFVVEYLKDLNATQAAIRAGYSVKTAKEMGYENLTKPHLNSIIQKQQKALQESTVIAAEAVILELARLSFHDVKHMVDPLTNALLPVHDIPTDTRRAIVGIKETTRTSGSGDNRETVRTREYKLANKDSALDKLGKTFGIFKEDRLQKRQPAPIRFNMGPAK